jgi:hypothetical protein
MSRPRIRPGQALAVAVLLVTSAPASAPADAPPQDPSWAEVVQRDRRVGFTRRSGHDARVEFLRGELAPGEAAAALMAIGCTEPQMVRERPLLEASARSGRTEEERYAALLALGEFGEGADAALLAHLEDEDPFARGCAMLGLLLSERRSSRERVQAIASGAGEDSALASRLLVQKIDPAASEKTEVGALYYRLRWSAARRYGLVDGQSWMTRVLGELLAEPRFLDAVVLGSVAHSLQLGVKDHLLARLLKQSGVAEMRAAAIAMPDELAALIESQLWKPRGSLAWRVLLDELEDQGTEAEALGLLALALAVPEVEVQALLLLARAGLPEPLVGLEQQWPELTPMDRRRAARAWAIADEPAALGWLAGFASDPDPFVRAEITVARARLGDVEAHEALRQVLLDPAHADFGVTLAAAAEQAQAPLPRGYLQQLLPVLEGEELLLAATALARYGVSAGRQALALALREGFPRGERGARCVRALAGRDAAAQIELFRQHFPAEDDLELNIALALAIVAAKDDLAMKFLHPALWSEPFDRSVLAALAMIQIHGLHGLRDELDGPPLEATSRDLRRVGFAVGEWGGVQAVEFLQSKWGLMPNDPILQGALLGALGRRTH